MKISIMSLNCLVTLISLFPFSFFEVWGQSTFVPIRTSPCTTGFNGIPGTVEKKSEAPPTLRLAFTNNRAPSPSCGSPVAEAVVENNKAWELINQCDVILIKVNKENTIIGIELSDATGGPQAVICP